MINVAQSTWYFLSHAGIKRDANTTLYQNIPSSFQFSTLFINQFYPRPGTPAAKMKRIPTQDVKKRTKELSDFFQTYHPYDSRVGQKYSVLVTETSHDGNYYVGHNDAYEQVLVPKLPELMGKLVQVEIIETCKFSMTGRLCDESAPVRPSLADALPKGQVSGAPIKYKDTRHMMWWGLVVLVIAILVRVFLQFMMRSKESS